MNKTISPFYVTKKQAKELRNRGFDYHKIFQDFADNYDYEDESIQKRKHKLFFPEEDYPNDKWIPIPQRWQVEEWLRINHDIDIIVLINTIYKDEEKHYFYEIVKGVKVVSKTSELHSAILDACHQEIPGNYVNKDMYDLKVFEMGFAFKTPQEAFSNALDFILSNLI